MNVTDEERNMMYRRRPGGTRRRRAASNVREPRPALGTAGAPRSLEQWRARRPGQERLLPRVLHDDWERLLERQHDTGLDVVEVLAECKSGLVGLFGPRALADDDPACAVGEDVMSDHPCGITEISVPLQD